MSARISRRTLLAGALAAGCSRARADSRDRSTRRLRTGINLAGLEFNSRALPGRFDRDYTAPRAEEFAYFASRGATAIRLPFCWERAEPSLGGGFDADYLGLIDDAVEYAGGRDMLIVLDAHQYGRRREGEREHIIGETPAVTAEHFAAFWAQMAERYRRAPHVAFGLSNEPHDQDMATLVAVQNRAIAAIREAGADQLVLASGNAWSGAHSWARSGNAEAMLEIRDPGDNFAFDTHQYLDRDSSGRNAACVAGAAQRLDAFTHWAREHGRRAFLGEFGAGPGEDCAEGLAALLDHMAENRSVWIGWTYWAGGRWWPQDYPLSVTPASLDAPVDRPQMTVLRRYFE